MINWEDLVLNVENSHTRLINISGYVLRNSGGLGWPILYALLFYFTSGFLTDFFKSIFLIAGCVLTVVNFLYIYAWKVFYNNRRDQFNEIVDLCYQLSNESQEDSTVKKETMNVLFGKLKLFNEKLKPLSL